VRIGQAMSPRLRGLIDAGLNAQARMVHLDEFHDNEVKMAARADQPRVISIEPDSRVLACYLRW
jgi:hypothetical protein